MGVALMRLRIPDEIKRWLREKAAENQRTMNGEITSMLKAAMKADQTTEAQSDAT